MVFRSLVQTWLQNAAKAKLRDVVVQTAQGRLAPATPQPPAEEPKPCHLAIVFALGIESGCLEDMLEGAVAIRGRRFVLHEGGLGGRRSVIAVSGTGGKNAAEAAELLIDGHQPCRVVSAGFADALCPEWKRNDILVADRLLRVGGGELPVELPAGLSAALRQPGVHRGTLLSTDRVVRRPSEKQTFIQRYGAMAVDGETFATAEVCLRRGVPFSSIRVINGTVDETLARDVEHLLVQKTGAARLGAAVGAIWRRPASAKDLYQLQENALVASGRIAKFIAQSSFE